MRRFFSAKKEFQKKSKNLLTRGGNCRILIKLSRESGGHKKKIFSQMKKVVDKRFFL